MFLSNLKGVTRIDNFVWKKSDMGILYSSVTTHLRCDETFNSCMFLLFFRLVQQWKKLGKRSVW